MRLFLACILCAAAQAATINTTITVTNGTGSFNQSGGITVAGSASLTNIGSGNFTATLSLGQNLSGPFTITLTGSPTVGSAGDTITGTVTVSAGIISGTGTGSAKVTGGTGAFANATGSFSSVSGAGNLAGTSVTFGFSGSGTITTGGSGGGGGGGGGGAAPTITQVANNYSYTPPGFANSGIAQGALFIIKGTGLADPSAQAVLQSSANGLPTTLNGASVKVTVNGTTTTPVFYYAIASQLALVLPSATPVGTGQVTVTYNGQSASAPIQVVQTAMGFDAYYGTGSGLGVATSNATGALYNYTNSIPPGTTAVLWGSGLGADPARDNTYVAAVFNINNLAHVYVGGVDAPIYYQGASGYPGVNQVDVTIPLNAPTGCNISLVGVTAAGVPTNFLTLPIGNGTCSDTAFGITGSDYQTLTGQSTVKTGVVSLSHSISPDNSGSGTQTMDGAFAGFTKETGSAYGDSGSGSVSIPGCTVIQTLGTGGTGTSVGLDAGTITVTGPNGNATLQSFPQVPGSYFAQLPSGFIPTSGGSFAFHGTGGADVGPFDTSIVFPNPLLTWTNKSNDATVNRGAGVLFTWTGGSPGTLVFMFGDSSGTVNGQQVSASFTCIAPQEDLQFQVPSYVTNVMPAGTGSLTISNYTNFQRFAPSGLDTAFAIGYSSDMANATYQ
jgi:uncharacterized protein (TIGR03437 family)